MSNSKYFLFEYKNYEHCQKNRILHCPPFSPSMTYEQTSMFNQLHREIETLRFEMDKKDETIKQLRDIIDKMEKYQKSLLDSK